MRIRCRKCGKVHEEWPSLEFCSPFYYSRLTKVEKEKHAELRTDFCVIKSKKQKDYFIRAILTQKVNDHCDSLEYGVWVLLNEESFSDYDQHFFEDDHKATYFGYLSNQIPGYDNTLSVRVTVHTNEGMERPDIVPHPDQSPNRFVADYYNGISAEDVTAKIRYILGDQ
jgi:hypothetical protein